MLLVRISFDAEGRKSFESAVITSCVEPLEESPQEAVDKELAQCPHLFPKNQRINQLCVQQRNWEDLYVLEMVTWPAFHPEEYGSH